MSAGVGFWACGLLGILDCVGEDWWVGWLASEPAGWWFLWGATPVAGLLARLVARFWGFVGWVGVVSG